MGAGPSRGVRLPDREHRLPEGGDGLALQARRLRPGARWMHAGPRSSFNRGRWARRSSPALVARHSVLCRSPLPIGRVGGGSGRPASCFVPVLAATGFGDSWSTVGCRPAGRRLGVRPLGSYRPDPPPCRRAPRSKWRRAEGVQLTLRRLAAIRGLAGAYAGRAGFELVEAAGRAGLGVMGVADADRGPVPTAPRCFPLRVSVRFDPRPRDFVLAASSPGLSVGGSCPLLARPASVPCCASPLATCGVRFRPLPHAVGSTPSG